MSESPTEKFKFYNHLSLITLFRTYYHLLVFWLGLPDLGKTVKLNLWEIRRDSESGRDYVTTANWWGTFLDLADQKYSTDRELDVLNFVNEFRHPYPDRNTPLGRKRKITTNRLEFLEMFTTVIEWVGEHIRKTASYDVTLPWGERDSPVPDSRETCERIFLRLSTIDGDLGDTYSVASMEKERRAKDDSKSKGLLVSEVADKLILHLGWTSERRAYAIERVSRACSNKQLKSSGKGKNNRRIDPESAGGWLLKQAEREA